MSEQFVNKILCASIEVAIVKSSHSPDINHWAWVEVTGQKSSIRKLTSRLLENKRFPELTKLSCKASLTDVQSKQQSVSSDTHV